MQRLTIKECAGFIAHALSKIETEGFMGILKQFQECNPNDAGEAIHSMYQNLCDGKSFQEAIYGMQIRFPPCIEEILVKSIENSTLDYALANMNKLYNSDYSEEGLFEHMSRLVDAYEGNLQSEIICHECLMREFEKIMKRAETEKAYEILFEQDGELYFIQRYLGIKPVKYIEPCHSKTYKTLLGQLNEMSAKGSSVTLWNNKYYAQSIGENRHRLFNDNVSLIMTFK